MKTDLIKEVTVLRDLKQFLNNQEYYVLVAVNDVLGLELNNINDNNPQLDTPITTEQFKSIQKSIWLLIQWSELADYLKLDDDYESVATTTELESKQYIAISSEFLETLGKKDKKVMEYALTMFAFHEMDLTYFDAENEMLYISSEFMVYFTNLARLYKMGALELV